MDTEKRLIVVANRLSVHRVRKQGKTRWEQSHGGLATALTPIMRARGGTWVGWTGNAGETISKFRHDGIQIVPMTLTAREIDGFYNGFSNRTLWPLYHDAIRTPEFHRRWWQPYAAVNERFARAAADVAEAGDVVWVHDYHLQLVPRMLRELRPELRIGFFLHIPFPPTELFSWLPWRGPLLEGLLGADVIGFQTRAAAQNFSRVARNYTEAEGTDSALQFDGRMIRVGAYPISIDVESFAALSDTDETRARVEAIRNRVGADRRIIFSVDRLDYTKGIDARLRAFGELLSRGTISARNCVFFQVAVPSREVVGDYADMRAKIEQLVGQINGEYSEPGLIPIHFFRRNLTREELVAYYRAADVMLVTPYRDGMNLVAKEYVASRTDHGGILVLSEFAGAAQELRRALLVNPYDIDGMAGVLAQAIELPPREARVRMTALRAAVRRNDVFKWADEFLRALTSERASIAN